MCLERHEVFKCFQDVRSENIELSSFSNMSRYFQIFAPEGHHSIVAQMRGKKTGKAGKLEIDTSTDRESQESYETQSV